MYIYCFWEDTWKLIFKTTTTMNSTPAYLFSKTWIASQNFMKISLFPYYRQCRSTPESEKLSDCCRIATHINWQYQRFCKSIGDLARYSVHLIATALTKLLHNFFVYAIPSPLLKKCATDTAFKLCRLLVLFFSFSSRKCCVCPEKVRWIANRPTSHKYYS